MFSCRICVNDMPYRIFVSGAQAEFAKERAALRSHVLTHEVLRRLFDVFPPEDTAATDRNFPTSSPDEIGESDIYVRLADRDCDTKGGPNVSPPNRESMPPPRKGLRRLVFLKKTGAGGRDQETPVLAGDAQKGLVQKTFGNTEDLVEKFGRALINFLGERLPRPEEFAATACWEATLDDLDPVKMAQFARTARFQGGPVLPDDIPPERLLARLDLLHDGHPTNAAILLFGKTPQRFLPNSEVRCLHFHGTVPTRPVASNQACSGTVSELVDRAVDFVLAKTRRMPDTGEGGAHAHGSHEIPREVVTEAIVNAVAHRDYTTTDSVQVMLLADRLVVLNSGTLPADLTPARLRAGHASRPRNPTIARALLWTNLVGRAGAGTREMASRCVEAGLPEPEFDSEGFFTTTVWRSPRKACKVTVCNRGRPIEGADVLVVLPSGESARVTTDSAGTGHARIFSPELPATVFVARQGVAAYSRHGWVPEKGELTASPDTLPAGGSVILHNRQGSLPGLRGSLMLTGVPRGRILLHATGFSVGEGLAQPIDIDLGNVRHIVDQDGRCATVRLVDMAGGAGLLQYEILPVRKDSRPGMLDNEVMALLSTGPLRTSDLLRMIGGKASPKRIRATVRRLMSEQLIEQTQPDSPRSPTQRYRLTDRGHSSVVSQLPRHADSDSD